MLFLIFAGIAIRGSRVFRFQVGSIGCAVLVALFAFEAKLEAASFAAISGLVSTPSRESGTGQAVAGGLPPAITPLKLNRRLETGRLDDSVLGGMPGENTMLCSMGDRQPVAYRADRYGFRNPDQIFDRRVGTMIIGDSFVEGICLPEGRDLVGRIRARHPDTAGFGVRGAGPLVELAMLGRFGPQIKPSHVVIIFYEGNDWENFADEQRRPWLADALSDTARFGPAILPAATIERMRPILYKWATAHSPGTLDVLRSTHLPRNFLALHQTWAQLGLGYPKAAVEQPRYAQVLARAQRIANGWGGRVTLVYMPKTSRLIGLFPNQFVFDQLRERVLAAASGAGIPVVDLVQVFEKQPKPIGLYGADGHLSDRGAELVARTLDGTINGAIEPAPQVAMQ